jgi:hypothetical protein
MVRELGLLFEEREIPYDHKEHRIFCFPHIVNIVVQHILSKFSKSVAPENDDAFDLDDDPRNRNSRHPKTFEEACARDPLSRVRKIVVAIRASGRRRDEYHDWIKAGNKK